LEETEGEELEEMGGEELEGERGGECRREGGGGQEETVGRKYDKNIFLFYLCIYGMCTLLLKPAITDNDNAHQGNRSTISVPHHELGELLFDLLR